MLLHFQYRSITNLFNIWLKNATDVFFLRWWLRILNSAGGSLLLMAGCGSSAFLFRRLSSLVVWPRNWDSRARGINGGEHVQIEQPLCSHIRGFVESQATSWCEVETGGLLFGVANADSLGIELAWRGSSPDYDHLSAAWKQTLPLLGPTVAVHTQRAWKAPWSHNSVPNGELAILLTPKLLTLRSRYIDITRFQLTNLKDASWFQEQHFGGSQRSHPKARGFQPLPHGESWPRHRVSVAIDVPRAPPAWPPAERRLWLILILVDTG